MGLCRLLFSVFRDSVCHFFLFKETLAVAKSAQTGTGRSAPLKGAGSFHTYANSKNLSLQFFTPFESLIMDFDAEQIKQVLTNLISNAVKFTPSGGAVKVRLKTESEELHLECSDTGIGIPEKDLPFIFDRFYQADNSSTRKGEGTGIGLAHTKELVKMMGGSLSATSISGKGAKLLVSLPIRNEAPIVADGPLKKDLGKDMAIYSSRKADPAELPHKTKGPDLRPQLLLIEDNPDVVVYLRSCLEPKYRLDIAYNGKIGIEKALEDIPDLIISDVMLPEKDGFKICRTLKSDERTSHIPIILLTAKSDVTSKLKRLRLGADAYLYKPFLKEELLIRLENLMELRRKLQKKYAGAGLDLLISKGTTSTHSHKDNKPNLDVLFLQKLNDQILHHLEDSNFSNAHLAKKMSISESQLFRKIKALTGISTAIYIRSIRLKKAKELLENTDLNISEVAYKVGFKDPSYFSRTFSSEFGTTPSAIRK